MMIFGYLGAVLTGVSLGLVGGGGSILMVPILVYLFETSATHATAYSLFVVGVASLIGALRYAKKDLIDYRTAVVFAIPAFLGVYLARRYLIPWLPHEMGQWGPVALTKDGLIMIVFSAVMLATSTAMIRKNRKQKQQQAQQDQGPSSAPPNSEGQIQAKVASQHQAKPAAEDHLLEQEGSPAVSYNFKWIALEGLGVGLLTGFVGAGGGFLIIPALVLLARLPMKLAVGTSLLIIAAKSLLGFLGDLGTDLIIDWTLLATITVAAAGGIFIGTHLSKYIPGKKLEPAFGWFVLIMGVYILGRQLV